MTIINGSSTLERETPDRSDKLINARDVGFTMGGVLRYWPHRPSGSAQAVHLGWREFNL